MKKFTITLLALVLGLGIMAQDLSYLLQEDGASANRDNEFVCLDGSVYSQVYPTFNEAYFADDGHNYTRAADDYTATVPFTSIRFWGLNYCGGAINASETFIIKFYERNLANPTIPGTEVNSITVSVTPVDLGITGTFGCDTPIYQVDADFGSTVSLLDGWVSVTRQNPGDNNFAVIAFDDGTGNEASFNGTWLASNTGNLLFCLGGTPAIPLSNWALGIGLLLISGFIVVRFKTRIA